MKKVITDMRIVCMVCGNKLTEEESDRKHCPYCKNALHTLKYPYRNRLVNRKEMIHHQ